MLKEDINIKDLVENEIGTRFNRGGKMCCPFHREKTPSFSYDKNRNIVTCFGSCNNSWDAIGFVREYKNLSYIEACEYLKIDTGEEYKSLKSARTKVLERIDWQLKNHEDKKEWVLDTLYDFVDIENNPIYFKAKFKTKEGKEPRYYRIEDNKVLNSLKDKEGNKVIKEVPYNLFGLTRAIESQKKIIIVEGEKDADTLIKKGFAATSLKASKFEEIDIAILKDTKVYICGDTGVAGERYINKVKNALFNIAKTINIIRLPYLAELGDNKDVTDWFNAGHTREEFVKTLNRCLDLKNIHELQQDEFGIKKHWQKFDKEGELIDEGDKYLTNFSIIKAKSIRYVDREIEGVELTFKNQEGEVFTRRGEATKFDDVKTFRNFLGTMALTFNGKMDDLNEIKKWIYKHFILEIETVFDGIQFKDNMLITPNKTFKNNSVVSNIVCSSSEELYLEEEKICNGDLMNLIIHLMGFQPYHSCVAILGTIINNFCIEQAKNLGVKFHHLLIVGESGSGKSTIKRNIINPLLGYSSEFEGHAMDKITDFALTRAISEGNYTAIFDEYKPSKMNEYKLNMISSTLRSAYDRGSVTRGKKDLSVNHFNLNCPVIICGEETYPHAEKALIERTLINYISLHERTEEQKESMEYLKEHSKDLRKLGFLLIKRVLELTDKEYKEIRDFYKARTNLKDRVRETFINTCTGIHLLNDVLEKEGIGRVYTVFEEEIEKVINENVICEGDQVNSIYEQMLIQFNDLLVDGRVFEPNTIIKCVNGEIAIRIKQMIECLHKHKKEFDLNYPLLESKDFRTQAEKGKYIIAKNKPVAFENGRLKADIFSKERLEELECHELVLESFKRK